MLRESEQTWIPVVLTEYHWVRNVEALDWQSSIQTFTTLVRILGSPEATSKPRCTSVDSTLTLDEFCQAFAGVILRGISQNPRPLAPGFIVNLCCALDDSRERLGSFGHRPMAAKP